MTELVKLPPEFERKALSLKQRNFSHFQTGNKGEQLARQFLVSRGLSIVGANIRWKQYEADILAQDGSQLVIVEVKTRLNTLVAPHLAISFKKVQSLQRFARKFVQLHYLHYKISLNYRIDAICITGKKIEHFENISWWK